MDGIICRGTLAAAVDNEILHTSFAPVLVPRSRLAIDPPARDPSADLFGLVPFRALGRMAQAIRAEYAHDLRSARLDVPTLDEFTRSIQINATQRGADPLRSATVRFVQQEAPRHYQTFVRGLIGARVQATRDDGQTLLKAQSALDAAHRAELKVRARHGVFTPDFETIRAPQRTSQEPLVAVNEIGILFLERLRIRPLGHTVERAPFFELSIEPGETVTLRQKSFSKRATSFESTVEESEERQLEYSSTFTTELAEEYGYTNTNTQNIGATHTGQFQYGVPSKEEGAGYQITASHTGEYGASSANSHTNTESVRDARTISRRVATTQKTLHRTVVSIAAEETLERESIRVIENSDTRTKKILMRRLMQVLHLSYERYGARMCWAPCIEEPGRDVRAFVPGNAAFESELQAIRDKWESTPPPEELGPGPSAQEVCTDWTEKLSGAPFGSSNDYAHELRIPDRYGFGEAYLQTREVDGSPNIYIDHNQSPARDATGVVTIRVHVGLSGGIDPENVRYRVCVVAVPGRELLDQHSASVRAWQQQQADKEIQEFLERKRKELSDLEVNAWPISELTRRVIDTYFFDPTQCRDCELVRELEQIFEWENLSYRLSAPWWRQGAQVDGLQSLRTTFLNASWARIFIPIRPGFEERAITWLMMVGAVPRIPDDLEYHLADLRTNVQPQYARGYSPSSSDAREIEGSHDIRLTELDAQDWDSAYERGGGFNVLDRWTVTIPTDGVDFETAFARCEAATPLRGAREDAAAATARVVDSIGGNIGNVATTVSLSVEAP